MKNAQKDYRGLVILDVDGVIYRDFFLKRLALYNGIKNYLKIIKLGLQYYKNKIDIQTLLERGYSLAHGISSEKAVEIAKKIRRVHKLKETISILKSKNYYVSIISAGVPNFVLRYLATEIGADHYSGLNISNNSNDLSSEKIKVISKIEVVNELIESLNLSWEKVVSIGDDPNNINLFRKSRISIGFNPTKSIRKEASIIVEGNNFLEILPYIIPEEELPKNLRKGFFQWKKELLRKLIHIFGIGVPFLSYYYSKSITLIALISFIIVYLFSEILRHHGLSFLLLAKITKSAQRHNETRNIILGPVFLGIGIFVTILIFPFKYYLPAILVVSISDTLSALIGKIRNTHKILNLKNSSVEGSLAFFVSSFIILIFFFPIHISLLTAFTATLLEIIPVYNLDNFIIPVGTAFVLYIAC